MARAYRCEKRCGWLSHRYQQHIVTAAWPDFFYVEADNRSSGIRGRANPATALPQGMRAEISGSVTTDSDGECCISAASASQSGSGSVAPLGLNNQAIGGGACGLQSAPYGWLTTTDQNGNTQRVWAQCIGLSNIGLLITTWGSVTYSDSTCFYIDDGSALDDGSGKRGIKVYGTVPVDPGVNPMGHYVKVTGISSCEFSSSGLVRVLEPPNRLASP